MRSTRDHAGIRAQGRAGVYAHAGQHEHPVEYNVGQQEQATRRDGARERPQQLPAGEPRRQDQQSPCRTGARKN